EITTRQARGLAVSEGIDALCKLLLVDMRNRGRDGIGARRALPGGRRLQRARRCRRLAPDVEEESGRVTRGGLSFRPLQSTQPAQPDALQSPQPSPGARGRWAPRLHRWYGHRHEVDGRRSARRALAPDRCESRGADRAASAGGLLGELARRDRDTARWGRVLYR